jgi:UDP:flavonoid glycosyltransferase YjiC (YdhE family)
MLGLYTQAREQAGLPARRGPLTQRALIGSGLLLRGHPELEYPGGVLPPGVHRVGPCLWEPPADPTEIAEIDSTLDRVGKPVVYAHLGRTFGGDSLWPRLNAAFTSGRFQAVVELGRSGAPQHCAGANVLVVRKPWMGPLIERSELVLTNATSAPVLAGLSRGRPLVVAPAGSEQPLLAQACLRAGVAARFPRDPGDDCAAVLDAARADPALRSKAGDLAAKLSRMNSDRAADLVEHAAVGDLASVR